MNVTIYEVTVTDNRTNRFMTWHVLDNDIRHAMIHTAYNYWNGDDPVQAYIAQNPATTKQKEYYDEDAHTACIDSACMTYSITARDITDCWLVDSTTTTDVNDTADEEYVESELEPMFSPVIAKAYDNIVFSIPEKFTGKIRIIATKIIKDLFTRIEPETVNVDANMTCEMVYIKYGKDVVSISMNDSTKHGNYFELMYCRYDTFRMTSVNTFIMHMHEDRDAETEWLDGYNNTNLMNTIITILADNGIKVTNC